MSLYRSPTLFISHGGGPWPYIEEMKKLFAKTAGELAALPSHLPRRPKAILAISGHWEADEFTVATSPQPSTEYDYSGFPEHTYHITYPAPGSPSLAARVSALLSDAGFVVKEDPTRGFDHGVFVPLVLMYPRADIPVTMLSLKSTSDPLEHIRVGEALAPLRNEDVLIMGSGLTYHNLRRFGPPGAAVSERFEAWLTRVVCEPDHDKRNSLLAQWESAPDARLAHPREDHLLPLMVAAGAARESIGERLFLDKVFEITMASYRFSDPR